MATTQTVATSSNESGYSYTNLPSWLNWKQYLAPKTNDPVYVAQGDNGQNYILGPDGVLRQGGVYLSNLVNGQYVSPANGGAAQYANPTSDAVPITWNTLTSAIQGIGSSPAGGASASTSSTPDPFAEIASAFAALQASPAPAIAPTGDSSSPLTDTTAVPTTTSGPNLVPMIVLLLLAAAVWWWWKHHKASSGGD